jgi:hypothetical protein
MMKWPAIALVCAAGIIGVETYLLLERVPPPPPAPPVLSVISIPPPPPAPAVAKPQAVRRTQRAHATTDSQRPFVMPTGGIFSGADPQDPRIYHFNAE